MNKSARGDPPGRLILRMTTDFQPGDTDVNLLQKILTQLGGIPRPGDLETGLLGKILFQMGGTPRPGDAKNVLYRKINQSAGVRTFPGDDTNKLLFRIAQFVNGNPLPGDTDNNLLRKWLGNAAAITDNDRANSTIPLTPGTTPGGDPKIDIFFDNDYWLNKWFAFYVSITDPGVTPVASDFVFRELIQVTSTPFVYEFILPTPSFSPSKVCLLISVGDTPAQALSPDIESMVDPEEFRPNCWIFPNQFSAPPEAPVATAATNISDDGFDANWNASAGATSYRLDVSESPVFASFVTGFEDLNVANVTTFSVSGLDPAVTYYYRVRAVNADGTSPDSNTISAVTEVTPASFAGLINWWRADSFGALADNTAIGGAGLEWIDEAGSLDAFQGTSAFQPRFRTAVFGTAPVIEFQFNGSFTPQQFMTLSAVENNGVNLAGNFTIVFVAQAVIVGAGNVSGGTLLGNAFTINDSAIEWSPQGTFPQAARVYGATANQGSASYATNGPVMVSIIRSGANLQFRKNAATVSSHVLGAVDLLRLNFMGACNFNVGGVIVRYGGYLGEVCIYNAALSDADLNALFTGYFQAKNSL